jgi:hypothetical protein
MTIGEAVRPADFSLKNFELEDQVDVLDVAQFLTANVYERSLFKAVVCKITLTALLARYNAIVDECETDCHNKIAFLNAQVANMWHWTC